VSARRFAPTAPGTTAILVAAVALGPLSTDLYLPSLPTIGRDLSADVAATQLTLSVFLAGFAFAQIPVGPLSDRFGRRPILIAGIALYLAASVACALAPTVEALIAARALQAVGACAGVVLGRAVVRDVYGAAGAARMLALIGSAMALAPAAGPILGGVVQAWFGWRWNFAILAAFGVALLVAAWLRLAETNAWRDPTALGLRRMSTNYQSLIASRAYIGFALIVAFSYAGLFSFISGSSFVLIDGLGVRPDRFGYLFAAVVFGYLTGTLIAGRLTLRLGVLRMVPIGCALQLAGGFAMLGFVLVGTISRDAWGVAAIVGPMVCYMIGTGITMPNAQAGAIGPYPRIAGAASALMGFLQMAIAALAGIGFGQLHDGTAVPMASLIALSALAAAACFVGLVSRPAG
jgi:DHA1 family bicyclomycin/chloramphenicol resistance-like MFS transporter